jgi:hypothetical protein
MGVGGFDARFSIWERLAGLESLDKVSSPEMRFGSAAERKVMDMAERDLGASIERQPIFICDEVPLLHATCDGCYMDPLGEGLVIVETKCFTGKNSASIASGILPESANMQIQAQLLCAKAASAVLYLYDANYGNTSFIRINPDPYMQREIILQAALMVNRAQGMLRIMDYKYKGQPSMDIEEAVKGYIATIPTKEETDKANLNAVYKDIISKHVQATGEAVSCMGVYAKPVKRKGFVRYQDVPELVGVDLDQYRGEPTIAVSVKYEGK